MLFIQLVWHQWWWAIGFSTEQVGRGYFSVIIGQKMPKNRKKLSELINLLSLNSSHSIKHSWTDKKACTGKKVWRKMNKINYSNHRFMLNIIQHYTPRFLLSKLMIKSVTALICIENTYSAGKCAERNWILIF